jgi:hypothetical protein
LFKPFLLQHQDFLVWGYNQSVGMSTAEGNEGEAGGFSNEDYWWRCRELNPGHCGYELKKADPRDSDLVEKLKIIRNVGRARERLKAFVCACLFQPKHGIEVSKSPWRSLKEVNQGLRSRVTPEASTILCAVYLPISVSCLRRQFDFSISLVKKLFCLCRMTVQVKIMYPLCRG